MSVALSEIVFRLFISSIEDCTIRKNDPDVGYRLVGVLRSTAAHTTRIVCSYTSNHCGINRSWIRSDLSAVLCQISVGYIASDAGFKLNLQSFIHYFVSMPT